MLPSLCMLLIASAAKNTRYRLTRATPDDTSSALSRIAIEIILLQPPGYILQLAPNFTGTESCASGDCGLSVTQRIGLMLFIRLPPFQRRDGMTRAAPPSTPQPFQTLYRHGRNGSRYSVVAHCSPLCRARRFLTRQYRYLAANAGTAASRQRLHRQHPA